MLAEGREIHAILTADSFWAGCAPWLVAAAASGSGILLTARALQRSGRRRTRAIASDRSGTVAMQFLLAFPVILLLAALTVQFLVIAKSSLTLHHAAYAAARSALVHKCPPISLPSGLSDLAGAAVRSMRCRDNPEAWTNAARIIATAVAPSGYGYEASSCDAPDALAELVLQGTVPTSGRTALKRKGCYAWDPQNLSVSVSWQSDLLTRATPNSLPPLVAEVRFRFPLVAPLGGMFSDGQHNDGLYWRWSRAEITLL